MTLRAAPEVLGVRRTAGWLKARPAVLFGWRLPQGDYLHSPQKV